MNSTRSRTTFLGIPLQPELVTTGRAALILGLARQSVVKRCDKGFFTTYRLHPRGNRRLLLSEVLAFQQSEYFKEKFNI